MSAQEFAEWRIVFANEGLHPQHQQFRHAQTLAATLQGASTKRSGKPWAAADFMPADPWAVPAQPMPSARPQPGDKPAKPPSAAARMKALFPTKRR